MRLTISLISINLLLICQIQAQKKTKIKFSTSEWQNETLIIEKSDQHFIPNYYTLKEIQPEKEEYVFKLKNADFYNLKIADRTYGIYLQPGFTYKLKVENGKLEVNSEDPLNFLLAENQKRFEDFQQKNTNLLGKRKKSYDSNYKRYIQEVSQLVELKNMTNYAQNIIYYELKRMEFNTLESAEEFKKFETEVIEKGVPLRNRAFITFAKNIYPSKINNLKFRESNIPPSNPTLYFLDEVNYIPHDTLKQFVGLVVINSIIYDSYSFEPNDSLVNNTLHKILQEPKTSSIKTFAKVLEAKMNQLKEGEAIPDFQFNLFNKPVSKLSDYKGQYILLDFWFSGCTPCIKAIPKLNAFDNKNENLTIIGVDPVDTEERFLKAIDKFSIKYAQTLVDGNSELPSYFNVSGYPTYILIDPDGKYLREFNSTNLNEIDSYLQ